MIRYIVLIFFIVKAYLTPINCVNLTASAFLDVGLKKIDMQSNQELRKLVDPELDPNTVYWHVMSGSSVFDERKKLNYLFERVFYTRKDVGGYWNDVDRSYLAVTVWSEDWKEIVNPMRIINIPGNVYRNGILYQGPEDARAIIEKNSGLVVLTFCMLAPGSEDRPMFQIKVDPENEFSSGPIVQMYQKSGIKVKIEKNWTPLFLNDELVYIYSLKPLTIIKCTEDDVKGNEIDRVDGRLAKCEVIGGERQNGNTSGGTVRGGTNWLQYKPSLFVSVGRTRLSSSPCTTPIYRPNLLFLELSGETAKLIYVSKPLTMFDDVLFTAFKRKFNRQQRFDCELEAVLTPCSFTRRENGNAELIMSVNDEMNIMINLNDLDRIIEDTLLNLNSSNNDDLIRRAEDGMRSYIRKRFSKTSSVTPRRVRKISSYALNPFLEN